MQQILYQFAQLYQPLYLHLNVSFRFSSIFLDADLVLFHSTYILRIRLRPVILSFCLLAFLWAIVVNIDALFLCLLVVSVSVYMGLFCFGSWFVFSLQCHVNCHHLFVNTPVAPFFTYTKKNRKKKDQKLVSLQKPGKWHFSIFFQSRM